MTRRSTSVSYREAAAGDRRPSAEPDTQAQKAPGGGKAKFIKLNNGPAERVNSTAHAMVKTVQYVLNNYPGHEKEI